MSLSKHGHVILQLDKTLTLIKLLIFFLIPRVITELEIKNHYSFCDTIYHTI